MNIDYSFGTDEYAEITEDVILLLFSFIHKGYSVYIATERVKEHFSQRFSSGLLRSILYGNITHPVADSMIARGLIKPLTYEQVRCIQFINDSDLSYSDITEVIDIMYKPSKNK